MAISSDNVAGKIEESAKKMTPKFDFDALVTMQKANLETFAAAQKIMFDLAQTMARKQADLMKANMGHFESMMRGFDRERQPQTYVDEMKAVVEKAMAEVKETMDLGVKAQHEVVDLLVKRASANFDEVKGLAA